MRSDVHQPERRSSCLHPPLEAYNPREHSAGETLDATQVQDNLTAVIPLRHFKKYRAKTGSAQIPEDWLREADDVVVELEALGQVGQRGRHHVGEPDPHERAELDLAVVERVVIEVRGDGRGGCTPL